MRRLNLVFLAILLVAAALLGGGVQLLHGFQVRRNASALLDRARQAEADHDLEKAEQALQAYLNLEREDGSAWERYARVVEQRDPARRRREHVLVVHEEALRHKPGDRKLQRHCAELALELGRFRDAEGHLKDLGVGDPVNGAGPGAEGSPPAAELAELEDMLGQCQRGQTKSKDAEKSFRQALEHDPSRVDTYDRLARMQRAERRPGAVADADATIAKMVVKNPKAGRAYIYRWRYTQEFAPPADDGDITTALKLAPEDLEVLYTAAVVAGELRHDAAAARAHFEKGCRLDSQNPAFALGLAHLELREGHPERAEAVLRRAFQARPLPALAFELADVLIAQGKLEGKDQAGAYLDHLRRVGLGETLGWFLEGAMLVQQRKWDEAIAKLARARAVLGAQPRLQARIDLMLAECHGRQGKDEERVEDLRRAVESQGGAESTGLALAQELAGSGRLDQAVKVLLPLVDRRPEWRLDLVGLLIQRAIRQPRRQRDWAAVEQQLDAAEQAPRPQAIEPLVLLRSDALAAQDRLTDARAVLEPALRKDPRNLRYRLALARLTQRQGQGAAALRILDQAERELGPRPEIRLARLDYWGQEGGPAARAALARLAASRQQVAAAERPALMNRLGAVAVRLGEPSLARRYWREQADLQPENVAVRLGLFDLALAAGDAGAAAQLVDEIRAAEMAEGDQAISWRFARASLLLDRCRRGASRDLDEARALAEAISQRRPNWWVVPTLFGEIAELSQATDQAIDHYLRALELGNVQPQFARRLVGLLLQRSRPGDLEKLEHVTHVLRSQGAALNEVTIVQALEALRRREFAAALALARQVFPEHSPSASDHLNLGRFYAAADQSDRAGEHYQRAVELGPGVPTVWLTYIQHLVQSKQIAQAQQAVEAARRALPPERASLTLAQCHLVLGDARRAEALVRKALDSEGKAEDPAALRLAIGVYLGQNRTAEAEKTLDQLDRLVAANPGEKAWVNRTRAMVLLSKNRPADRDRALELVERNLAASPESIEDQQLRATILALRPGCRGEAIALLERLAGANRLGAGERFLLAQLYLDQRDEPKYEGQMRTLLDLKPRNPRHLAHFANYWIDRNRLDQAKPWLAELKRSEPKGLAALELEARLLDRQHRQPELRALLQARGREVPDQIGPVADLLSRYGFAQEAEAAYKAFIAREPRQPERTLALVEFLVRQDRVAEALAVLRKAWSTCRPEQVAAAALPLFDAPTAGEAEKRQVEAWVAEAVRQRPEALLLASKLGVIWIRQGRFEEAETVLRRVLAGQPDSSDALNNLAWLLSLRDPGKAAEAITLMDRAIAIAGETPGLADTRAVARIRSGQIDQAVTELLAIRKQAPGNPSFALHLAWAYQARGQSAQARVELQEADKLGLKPTALDPLERAIVQKLRHELFPG
jgi:tetratricopeptide (TPR) repeat protein